MEKNLYVCPKIKVIDYITKHRLMDEVDPTIDTSQQLGKSGMFDDIEDDSDWGEYHNVWEDSSK